MSLSILNFRSCGILLVMLGQQQQMALPGLVAMAAALLLGRSRPDLAQGALIVALIQYFM
jgi:hypothetical protein